MWRYRRTCIRRCSRAPVGRHSSPPVPRPRPAAVRGHAHTLLPPGLSGPPSVEQLWLDVDAGDGAPPSSSSSSIQPPHHGDVLHGAVGRRDWLLQLHHGLDVPRSAREGTKSKISPPSEGVWLVVPVMRWSSVARASAAAKAAHGNARRREFLSHAPSSRVEVGVNRGRDPLVQSSSSRDGSHWLQRSPAAPLVPLLQGHAHLSQRRN